jgi:predicted metal-dependent hydrolase
MNAQVAEEWRPLEDVVTTEVFKAEVAAWAQKIGVEPKQLHIRPMRRKWGSCSTNGRVTFDTDLLTQSAEFRKEVIVHELLHLKVPNHSTLFRALLRAHLGRSTLHEGVASKTTATSARGSPAGSGGGARGRKKSDKAKSDKAKE